VVDSGDDPADKRQRMEPSMKRLTFIATAIAAGLILFAPAIGRAQTVRDEVDAAIKDYLAAHPDEIGEIVKNYMIRHPEALGQIFAEALKHRPQRAAMSGGAPAVDGRTAADRSAAIASNATALFSSPHQVTLGNPHGDVTLVEFFDYSCGFCRRALPDMLALIKDDPNLKVVLKEFPILGPGSVEAARIAVAVRMQDADGQKYLAFHQQLLGSPGPASKEKALAAARDQGLDMTRLEKDAASEEVAATLAEDSKLAAAMGIRGTPGYVVGNSVVLGAVGLASLKQRIEAARGHGPNSVN
jgi:protein-disulfide isomerase